MWLAILECTKRLWKRTLDHSEAGDSTATASSMEHQTTFRYSKYAADLMLDTMPDCIERITASSEGPRSEHDRSSRHGVYSSRVALVCRCPPTSTLSAGSSVSDTSSLQTGLQTSPSGTRKRPPSPVISPSCLRHFNSPGGQLLGLYAAFDPHPSLHSAIVGEQMTNRWDHLVTI